ncbi:hypothetical protein C8R47DRAFT_1232498 [Mycena vitilis]|nr:hypothetical protein C8R47DRAFT_1232498 [Mycena vitilis]
MRNARQTRPRRRDTTSHADHPPQQAESLQDEALLRYYAAEWDRYTTGANYLNRYWVKRERDEGKKAVYQVYTMRTLPFRGALGHTLVAAAAIVAAADPAAADTRHPHSAAADTTRAIAEDTPPTPSSPQTRPCAAAADILAPAPAAAHIPDRARALAGAHIPDRALALAVEHIPAPLLAAAVDTPHPLYTYTVVSVF